MYTNACTYEQHRRVCARAGNSVPTKNKYLCAHQSTSVHNYTHGHPSLPLATLSSLHLRHTNTHFVNETRERTCVPQLKCSGMRAPQRTNRQTNQRRKKSAKPPAGFEGFVEIFYLPIALGARAFGRERFIILLMCAQCTCQVGKARSRLCGAVDLLYTHTHMKFESACASDHNNKKAQTVTVRRMWRGALWSGKSFQSILYYFVRRALSCAISYIDI